MAAAPSVVASAPPSASSASLPAPPPDRRTCAAAFFPEEAFGAEEDFKFLCKDDDLRAVTALLHQSIVRGGRDTGGVTEAMKEWATLSWYELAVAATMRQSCCPEDQRKLKLPKYQSVCDHLADSLQELSKPPIPKGEALVERSKEYHRAVKCLFDGRVARPYHYRNVSNGQNRLTFKAIVERGMADTAAE
jgi:hypothetical protein